MAMLLVFLRCWNIVLLLENLPTISIALLEYVLTIFDIIHMFQASCGCVVSQVTVLWYFNWECYIWIYLYFVFKPIYIYDIHMLSQLSHINTIGSIHCGCVLQGGPCLLPALRLKGRFLDAAVAGWNSLAIPESPFWVVLAIKLWVVHCFTLLYHITFIRYTVSYIWLYMMYTVKEHTSII
jgi:hypothetical protein